MENLTQAEKVGVWTAIVVVIIVFIALGFFQRDIRRATQDDSFLNGEEVSEESIGEEGELVIEDTILGDGEEAEAGDTVTVHYIGRLSDGTVFDSSVDRGEPFTFELGAGQVIAGWEQGIIGMSEGGVRMLAIPPELAYGSRAIGPIPANSTLHFEVQLLEVAPSN